MIGEFSDDTRPKVARFNGKVVIYAIADGEEHGFLLDDRATVDTATRMLGAVADLHGDTAFSHSVDAMTFQVMSTPGRDPEGILTFRFNGAPVSATIDAIQIAEIAAAFTRASAYVDRPAPPRSDH
jgi:hypothetical protein